MISKIFFTCLLFISFFFTANAQTYPVVVKFTSECCGVPDNKPLMDFVKSFRKQYKIKKITLYRIGPLGREGEYDLAFPLKEMTKSQAKVFRAKLAKVSASLKGQGKATLTENETYNKSDLPQRATVEKIII